MCRRCPFRTGLALSTGLGICIHSHFLIVRLLCAGIAEYTRCKASEKQILTPRPRQSRPSHQPLRRQRTTGTQGQGLWLHRIAFNLNLCQVQQQVAKQCLKTDCTSTRCLLLTPTHREAIFETRILRQERHFPSPSEKGLWYLLLWTDLQHFWNKGIRKIHMLISAISFTINEMPGFPVGQNVLLSTKFSD